MSRKYGLPLGEKEQILAGTGVGESGRDIGYAPRVPGDFRLGLGETSRRKGDAPSSGSKEGVTQFSVQGPTDVLKLDPDRSGYHTLTVGSCHVIAMNNTVKLLVTSYVFIAQR